MPWAGRVEGLLLLVIDERQRQPERDERAPSDGNYYGPSKANGDPTCGDQRRIARHDARVSRTRWLTLRSMLASLVTASLPRLVPRGIRAAHGFDIASNY